MTALAATVLTESDLRAALESLDKFKASGLNSVRFDPQLPSGAVISFQRRDTDSEWALK